MDNIIRQIREIMGNHWSSQINIHIYTDEISFDIYESEIPVIVDLKEKEVYIDCESMVHHLTSDMLYELFQIVVVLEENLNMFVELLKWKEEEIQIENN